MAFPRKPRTSHQGIVAGPCGAYPHRSPTRIAWHLEVPETQRSLRLPQPVKSGALSGFCASMGIFNIAGDEIGGMGAICDGSTQAPPSRASKRDSSHRDELRRLPGTSYSWPPINYRTPRSSSMANRSVRPRCLAPAQPPQQRGSGGAGDHHHEERRPQQQGNAAATSAPTEHQRPRGFRWPWGGRMASEANSPMVSAPAARVTSRSPATSREPRNRASRSRRPRRSEEESTTTLVHGGFPSLECGSTSGSRPSSAGPCRSNPRRRNDRTTKIGTPAAPREHQDRCQGANRGDGYRFGRLQSRPDRWRYAATAAPSSPHILDIQVHSEQCAHIVRYSTLCICRRRGPENRAFVLRDPLALRPWPRLIHGYMRRNKLARATRFEIDSTCIQTRNFGRRPASQRRNARRGPPRNNTDKGELRTARNIKRLRADTCQTLNRRQRRTRHRKWHRGRGDGDGQAALVVGVILGSTVQA